MRFLFFLFLITTTFLSAQSIDYNLKKGFIANGYDVVEYFDNNAVEGKKNFTTKYDGVKFKFSSQENLDTFLKAPEKYVPQYGGYCAYAVAVDSKKVSINPETFEIRDNKLYLFYNSWGVNTLKKWQKNNVKGLQKKADQNWEAIKN
ncbi:MAG: YHS domain-containing protein [Winogradskyella sp.]|uniref:YHS domain-containing (seleno)protein n=1 Tax=Winogradskyella sp. TaxID=1883156 RepID=UPI000F3B4EAF|nr:YHS domain-containing (seleno)protein [Winogradskyella sp.]RNC87782.1 MAG: YHS domain-containing protein [Winogradskyella sp.]